MKSKSIILSVLIFWGCGSIPKNYTAVNGFFKTNSSECETLVEEVQRNWAKHDSLHCFYLNMKLIDKIEVNKNCFLNIDTTRVIDLLGNPNRNNDHYLGYNLSRKCKAGDDFYSEYVLNFIHNNGFITKVDFKLVET